jgi:hypothetical protein
MSKSSISLFTPPDSHNKDFLLWSKRALFLTLRSRQPANQGRILPSMRHSSWCFPARKKWEKSAYVVSFHASIIMQSHHQLQRRQSSRFWTEINKSVSVTSPFNLDGQGTRSRFCCQDILLPLAFRCTLQLAILFDTPAISWETILSQCNSQGVLMILSSVLDVLAKQHEGLRDWLSP